MLSNSKNESRKKRHRSIRKRIEGNTERPRLSVFRSTRHIYAQVIDDLAQKTLVSTSDVDAEKGAGKKKDRAKQVGTAIAKLLSREGDRQGRLRPNGLQVSRTGLGAGGRRARSWAQVLKRR